MKIKSQGIALDCSVTLPWYLEDERTTFTENLLNEITECELWVPALWRLEFANALIVAEKRGRISTTWHRDILKHASQLPIQVDSHIPSLQTLSELAISYKLTTYDAAYLELARRRKLMLATLDKALSKAAHSAKISVKSN